MPPMQFDRIGGTKYPIVHCQMRCSCHRFTKKLPTSLWGTQYGRTVWLSPLYKTLSVRLPIQMAMLGVRLNYSVVKTIVFQPNAASGSFSWLLS